MELKDVKEVFKMAFKLTMEKKIQWNKVDKTSYSVDFSSSSIMSFRGLRGSAVFYGFKLLNMRGEPIASIDSDDEMEPEILQMIKDLYKIAKENYMLTDETYSDIFTNLKNLDKK